MLYSFITATLMASVSCTPIFSTGGLPTRDVSSKLLPPTIIEEFPIGTWLENLVIRQKDGNAIVTVLSAPEVYLVSTTSSFEPVLATDFPGNLGVLGIVELGHDVFYVAVGNWSVKTAEATPGSWSIWELDLNGWDQSSKLSSRKVASLPHAGFLNGMAILDPAGLILVADSLYSAVWKVDVHSGSVEVALNSTAMAINPSLSLSLGVNGIKIDDGFLYFDNTDLATFNRIPIGRYAGEANGSVETFADSQFPSFIFDDFVLDFAGNAWVPSGRGELVLLKQNDFKSIEVVAGDITDPSITGFTAVKFGTSQQDVERGSLYVTTCAGAVNYFFSNWTAGGMLLRYDTALLSL